MPPGTADPGPPPEGRALRLARESWLPAPMSIREAARRAGAVSETHWRHVEAGYESKGGMKIPVRASAKTLARMALAVGLTPQRLEEAGRGDAAEILAEILRRTPVPEADADSPLTDEELASIAAYTEALRRARAKRRARDNEKPA